MFRTRPFWVASCLLLATTLFCVPKATPDAASVPQRAQQTPTPSPPPDDDRLLQRRAAILRAEDRRIVDAALEAETGAAEAEMRARAVAALCEVIRKEEKYAQTPVIILSTESEADDKLRGFKAGANLYMMKPIKSEELIQNVKMLVTGS